MDYKSVFTNLCLELKQNRSWIKGLGKNPQKSELIHWRQCLLSGGIKRVPSDSEKHRRVYTSSNVCHSHEWRVDTASGKTLKKRNACLHTVRQAVEKKLRVYMSSEAKGLKRYMWLILLPYLLFLLVSDTEHLILSFNLAVLGLTLLRTLAYHAGMWNPCSLLLQFISSEFLTKE